MSTYKRPALLKAQLSKILQQTFTSFEVIISDNDPDVAAKQVVENLNDKRLKYFSNAENIGMIKSFNKSINRSTGQYVVMITDDDPVVPEMLAEFYDIVGQYPDYGIYCGCKRPGVEKSKIEIFNGNEFIFQLLSPDLTSNLLWSSCLLDKRILVNIGGMPDYGSPHLADHAMLALCGSFNGGVMINKMFSYLVAHDNNFSKSNIDLYLVACKGFYNLITSSIKSNVYIKNNANALKRHLERWFITYSFTLRKYYTYYLPEVDMIASINENAKKTLALPFMKTVKKRYFLKLAIFKIKNALIKLNIIKIKT